MYVLSLNLLKKLLYYALVLLDLFVLFELFVLLELFVRLELFGRPLVPVFRLLPFVVQLLLELVDFLSLYSFIVKGPDNIFNSRLDLD